MKPEPERTQKPTPETGRFSRRDLMQGGAGLAAAAAAGLLGAGAPALATGELRRVVERGLVRQSVVFWCFNLSQWKWDLDKTATVAKALGCKSVELVDPQGWPTLKKHGLTCAIAPNGMPGPPFATGLNNRRYHEEVIGRTKKNIDACVDFGCPNVIAFNGYKWRDAMDPASGTISREEGAETCVGALENLARHAEKKGVTVCLEMLNTRDDTHPMKGHPGYQGDDLDYVADIVKRVGSPRVKVLFDVYHVQVMNGDLLRRIRQYADIIGHVHTAGNPGRGELSEAQEISYPAVMRALLDVGYKGYVGHEFIPTRTPEESLAQAVKLCDV